MTGRDVQVLAGRLNTGWIVCNQEPNDEKHTQLEDYWISLLHQYEEACDQAEMIEEATAA